MQILAGAMVEVMVEKECRSEFKGSWNLLGLFRNKTSLIGV